LPARQRAAIALTYDEGLSNAEGASILQISTGAFELLLVRARRALRLALMDRNEK
jgi:RNA polymerase sigma-70 factor, ECF subfamily